MVPLVENPKPYFCTFKSRSIYVIPLHTLTVGCLYNGLENPEINIGVTVMMFNKRKQVEL
jgi:hypothetical protein